MLRNLSVLIVVLSAAPVFAQPAPYAPVDADLWGLLGNAIADMPMSMSTHQKIQNLMQSLQQEARLRAARAEAEAKARAPKEDGK